MKEKQTIHRIYPCHRFDIEGIQTWLEDMAKDGWILEKGGYGLGTFTFQRSYPVRCRYRLEVVFESRKSYLEREEYLEMLKEFGWTHITEFQGFEIFCTEDLHTTEISTDPQIQATTLKKLKRERIGRFIFLILHTILLTLNRRLGWFFLFRSAVTFGPIITGLFLIFIGLCMLTPLFDLFQLHKVEKKLRSGILLNQRTEWKPRAALNRFCEVFPTVLGLVVIIGWLSAMVMATNQQSLADDPPDPPFVTIRDLSDGGYALTDPPLSGNNHYVTWQNLVAPVNYEWREYAKFSADGAGNTGFLIVEYHDTISEWFAQGLADDYYLYETARDRDNQDLEADDYGLDEVRVFGSFGSYDILIRHGTTVIYASYTQWNDGAVPDWQIWLEAMAETLLE